MSEQLIELGNQFRQEQIVQADLKNKFEESTKRAAAIQAKLNQLALDAFEGTETREESLT